MSGNNTNLPPKDGEKSIQTELHKCNKVLNQTAKNLIRTSLILSLFLIPTTTFAQGADADPANLNVPTLDALAGKPIPNTDPQEYYPADMKSAYTLTEITPADPDNLPPNTITKYEIDPIKKNVIPHYYTVALKQTEFGTGDSEKYFKWTETDGKRKLEETSTASDAQITAKYDATNPQARINNTTDQSATDINGSFINLSKTGSGDQYGGAIYNNSSSAKLGNITGDFIGNYASSSYAAGGAIYNNAGTIGDITGDFIGNYASSSDSDAEGGAIYNNRGTIGNIIGDFIGNYASSSSAAANGGVISNGYGGIIGDITGDFIGNYVSSSSDAEGGAIYNNGGTIGDITGDFIGNYASSSSSFSYANGGAISNISSSVKLGNITGDFIGNYSSSSAAASAIGGAIYNYDGTIGDITGDFIGNYASSSSSYAIGGAIYNDGTIGNITGDFIGNYAVSSSSSSSYAEGGAISNYGGTIGKQDADGKIVGGIINSSFLNNYAKADGPDAQAKGGAIYNWGTNLNIIADNGTSLFSGNKTITNGVEDQNAIAIYGDYEVDSNSGEIMFFDPITGDPVAENPTTLTLQAKNNGTIRFDDKISGGAVNSDDESFSETSEYAYNLNITGDSTGKVIFNNEVKNANISVENTNVYVTDAKYIAPSPTLAVNSGVLNVNNLGLAGLHYDTFANDGTINLTNVNVDLQNEKMGTLTADAYGSQTGSVNVQSILLLNDAAKDKTNIFFAPEEYAANVSYTGANPIAYSPIYKYNVSYSQNPEDNLGYFMFSRGSASNPSDNYNPAVLAPSVATQAGAYTTQLQTFNYAFQHSDNFMNIPNVERFAMKNSNKYALSPTSDPTDVGVFSPLFTKEENAGFWVKPYASFENIPLHNGPKVDNINYGTLIGYDSQLAPIRNGWDRVLTGYIGYNGASQRYSGVDAYQNGGILGTTVTLYKNNFFNATTINVGASAGDATTMYGSENYTMLLAGIANKTGYNIEFKKGRYIIQPSMLISYTFVNTFDYKNAAGVSIKSDPLNALQLAPGVKFIMNTKNGWQPYLGVSMIWNILDQSRVTANDVRLPSMSIDPYVQYGAGIQRRWAKRYTAFAQAMIHNGGRNGVSLTCGFRWAVGKQ